MPLERLITISSSHLSVCSLFELCTTFHIEGDSLVGVWFLLCSVEICTPLSVCCFWLCQQLLLFCSVVLQYLLLSSLSVLCASLLPSLPPPPSPALPLLVYSFITWPNLLSVQIIPKSILPGQASPLSCKFSESSQDTPWILSTQHVQKKLHIFFPQLLWLTLISDSSPRIKPLRPSSVLSSPRQFIPNHWLSLVLSTHIYHVLSFVTETTWSGWHCLTLGLLQ